MKRVLSFDPGHDTGIACYDEAGNYEFSMNADSLAMAGRYFFSSLVRMAQPDVVLVEELPQKQLDTETTANYYYIIHWMEVAGYEVVTILPGQWKKFAKRVEISGTHARDAATMARWWIENKQ